MKRKILFFLLFAVLFTFVPVIIILTKELKGSMLLFFIFFILAEIIIWGFLIFYIKKAINNKKALKKGKEYIATFVSVNSNVSSNGVPLFSIEYYWMDEYGVMKHGKSLCEYTENQARAFEIAKQFKIKADGNNSVIISKPFELMNKIDNSQNVQQTNQTTEKKIPPKPAVESKIPGKLKCENCASWYDSKLEKCPFCGKIKKIERIFDIINMFRR